MTLQSFSVSHAENKWNRSYVFSFEHQVMNVKEPTSVKRQDESASVLWITKDEIRILI